MEEHTAEPDHVLDQRRQKTADQKENKTTCFYPFSSEHAADRKFLSSTTGSEIREQLAVQSEGMSNTKASAG